MKEPTVRVPVTVFLDLARVYKTEPQELINRQSYLQTINLEKEAYRKFNEYRKYLKEILEGTTHMNKIEEITLPEGE